MIFIKKIIPPWIFHKFKGEFFYDKKTSKIAKIGMLAAAAFILQVIGTYLGIKVGGFLDVEISDLPALIGALALGPGAGVMIEFVKNIFALFYDKHGICGRGGEFYRQRNFSFSPQEWYTGRTKPRKTALIGLVLGTLAMSIAGIFLRICFFCFRSMCPTGRRRRGLKPFSRS
ncbi:MAG: ECF transporter S component [Clostridiales bacterium]|nr:MAG: ECF transporter S component [Clostridiales bacterium]